MRQIDPQRLPRRLPRPLPRRLPLSVLDAALLFAAALAGRAASDAITSRVGSPWGVITNLAIVAVAIYVTTVHGGPRSRSRGRSDRP